MHSTACPACCPGTSVLTTPASPMRAWCWRNWCCKRPRTTPLHYATRPGKRWKWRRAPACPRPSGLGLWFARMDSEGKRQSAGIAAVNFKRAIRWLTQAGEQGLAEAWYALSRIYMKPEFSQRVRGRGASLPGARGRNGASRRPAGMRQCVARAPRERAQRRARRLLAAEGGGPGLRRKPKRRCARIAAAPKESGWMPALLPA
jgi:hypothetical protein